MSDLTPYSLGYAAGRGGVEPRMAPFDMTVEECSNWTEGFDEGRNDILSDEEVSDEDKDISQLLDEYQSQEKMHCFEGETGIRHLNKVCAAIGYKESGFRFGSPLEEFLQDNPGCMEVIMGWIGEQDQEEWKENLISNLEAKECDTSG